MERGMMASLGPWLRRARGSERTALPIIKARLVAGWRRLARPRSLRTQMAAGSVLVALVAVALVAVTALIAVTLAFRAFQRTELEGEAAQIAAALDDGQSSVAALDARLHNVTSGDTRYRLLFTRLRPNATDVWVMDASGRLLVAPTTERHDQATLQRDQAHMLPALHAALAGRGSEDTLEPALLPILSDRPYVVVPIHQGGQATAPVIGALALTIPPGAQSQGVLTFLNRVNVVVWLAALVAAVLAALAASLFARRLTRPLAALSAATASMAAGDYAVRVRAGSAAELRDLAASFNEMAAALERDVSDLRWQEQTRRELVANVAHELATPLTAIEGFSEALLDGKPRDEAARGDMMRTIAREAARLHRLVSQLRQMALVEAGALRLDRRAVALASLVEETLAVLAPEVERRHVTVASTLPADLLYVYADGDQMTEVLLNLLDNALRHTPHGGRVEVTGSASASQVTISIADSGSGVALEARERVFERFFRTDPSRSASTGGSGLGLAIVRALVEAHGGAITADERPGGGARFTFTLPRMLG